jgi:hypothetical protein
MATDGASARVVKRSLVIAGHRTSVSLEDAFWRRLRGIAAERGLAALHVPSLERGALWGSEWMLLSPDPSRLRDEAIDAASLPELGRPERIVWTDEWSDVLRVIKR